MGDKTAQFIITVDGPSGSGKGTLSRRVADALGFFLLDSGALYRVLGFHAQRQSISFEDHQALGALAQVMPVEFRLAKDGESVDVLLEDQDVSRAIRTEEVGRLASLVAKVPSVREGLLALQRSFAQPPGLVADGRDMGTTVFPFAQIKIFLKADPTIRAKRRYKQLKEKGFDANLAALEEELHLRDKQDTEREISPLRPAADATVIDSSNLSADEVFQQVINLVRLYNLPI